jgi:hypothetical protein
MSLHSLRPDSDGVANPHGTVSPSTASETVSAIQDEAEARHDVGDLAVAMRTVVTPVIGYLELISQDDEPISDDRHLHWIDTIEKRLEAMRELNDEIARTCAVLRGSLSGPEAAPPRGPEAPGD